MKLENVPILGRWWGVLTALLVAACAAPSEQGLWEQGLSGASERVLVLYREPAARSDTAALFVSGRVAAALMPRARPVVERFQFVGSSDGGFGLELLREPGQARQLGEGAPPHLINRCHAECATGATTEGIARSPSA